MKLLTYDSGSGPRCGVLRGDDVVDVADLLGVNQPLQDVRALLELSESAVDQVRTALASNSAAPSVPWPAYGSGLRCFNRRRSVTT